MRQQHSAVSWRHFVFLLGLERPPSHSPHPSSLCRTHSWQEREQTCGRNEANGRESQYDKPCEQAHVNTRVTCTVGDSCVTDASQHAGVDRLTPLSV